MKRGIILLFFIITICILHAQKKNYDDVIYLKNGSELRGTLIDFQTEAIKLEIAGGKQIAILQSDIEKIVQKPILNQKTRKSYEFKEEGIYKAIFGSFTAGTAAWNNDFAEGFGFRGVVGYQWNRWFGTGFGIGIDNYYPSQGETVYPVFLELRGYLSQENVSPYYSFSGGYAFTFEHEAVGIIGAEGGYLIHPAIGLRFGGGAKTNFTLDGGIQIQRATFVRGANNLVDGSRLSYRMLYKRLSIRLGMLF